MTDKAAKESESIIERLERLSAEEAEAKVFRNCALISKNNETDSATYALPGLRLTIENGAVIGYQLERDFHEAHELAYMAALCASKGTHDGTYPREATVEVKIKAKKHAPEGISKPERRTNNGLPLIGSLKDTVPYMVHGSFRMRLVGEYFQAFLRNERLKGHVKTQEDPETRRELMNQGACLTLYLGCLRDRAKRLGIDFGEYAAPMAPVEDK